MAGSDFLAKIRLALEGKEQVVSGLKQTQQAAQQLSKTKVTTTVDSQGVATGKQIEETFSKIKPAAEKASLGMNDFRKALARVVVVAPIWMIARGAMMSVFNLIQSNIKFVFDLEDAMARIQIVGKGTAEQYDNLKYSLMGLSLAYGISASDALTAAKIFAQQGKTVSETFVLTRAAMIGAQALGKPVVEVVEDLTAAMKAFNIPAVEATSIIDKFVAVEKNFAVTSKDLASGVKVVGATANQVGVSLAALTGDITAVIEVTRKSGSEAARGLQFIYARLLTSGKAVVQQITGVNFYLDEQGRSTNALTGVLRNATDILDDVASKWGKLTNEERLNIAQSLGSKRQLVVLNALMQNYTSSIDARITALTASGSAEKSLAILMETARYKTQQLSSAFNALTLVIADTSAWKGLIDNIKFALVFYAKLINFEKGYRMELAAVSTAQLANIETRQAQVSSIEELIKMRNKLLSEPPNDKTSERLDKINKAIEATVKDQPTIKLAIESGKPEDLRKAINDVGDKLTAEKVVVQVGVDFIPQLAALDKRKKELQDSLSEIAPIMKGVWGKKELTEIAGIDKKRIEVLKNQSEEAQKQLKLAKAQSVYKDISDDEEASQLRGELTAKELESLEIARKLNNYKSLSNATAEEAISKEIELVRASQSVYDQHAKTLKLSQLENSLIDAKLKKRDDEISKLASLSMQYEKADMLEKSRIRRAAELALMSKEEIANAYQNNSFDKRVIEEFWGSFSKEAQRAVEETTTLFNDLQYKIPTIENLGANNALLNKTELAAPIAQLTQSVVGAQKIDIIINGKQMTAEEISAIIGTQISSNPEFRKAIADAAVNTNVPK